MMSSHPERRLTIAVADYLRLMARPGLVWTHFPAGEYRREATGRLLNRMGLQPGWPDFLIIGSGGTLYGLELKTEKGRQTESQKKIQAEFKAAGATYLLCHGWDEAIETLEVWGFVKRKAAA